VESLLQLGDLALELPGLSDLALELLDSRKL